MLVSRAQLSFIRDLVASFERNDSMMQPVVYYQSQYVAIIALLRSVGHVFEKVDCSEPARQAWSKAQWLRWRQEPIFREFIEPTRNSLLKEFRGGLQFFRESFGPGAVITDPTMHDGVSEVVSFDVGKLRDLMGRPVLPNLYAGIEFWDRCLKEAELEFDETP